MLDYGTLFFGTLAWSVITALAQLGLAFYPRFSWLALGNALMLLTVFVPLAINRLNDGTRVGWWLWLINGLFSTALAVRWSAKPRLKECLPVLGSVIGLLAFGSHVFIFSACP